MSTPDQRIRFSRKMLILLVAFQPGANPLLGQVCPQLRVSVAANGAELSTSSEVPDISADGRFVCFWTNFPLVPGDTNGLADVYAIDLLTGLPELVTATAAGVPSNGPSTFESDLSVDGRFVAFASYATNLLPGLDNNIHTFVRDRAAGQTTLLSVKSNGGVASSWGGARISDDARYAVFTSSTVNVVPGDHNGASDIFLRDTVAGATALISVSLTGTTGNAWSGGVVPSDITGDGRLVVFTSNASDLVPNDSNGHWDVFFRDLVGGVTGLVSVSSSGAQGDGDSLWGQCSEDGSVIVFQSVATNLVTNDTNGHEDVFLRDTVTGTTARLSVDSSGLQANDRSSTPTISRDGRFVAFSSLASNLVLGDSNFAPDVFVFDRVTSRLERVSVGLGGIQPNDASTRPSISGSGDTIVFNSLATNLVPGDLNGVWDVFSRQCPLPSTYCVAKANSLGCLAEIASVGIPLSSWPRDFTISATQVLNQKTGMLFYGITGPAALPFHGGTLCVQPPLRRTPALQSGGSTGSPDCSGILGMDFNRWIASGANPSLVSGATVWSQYWIRDPGFTPPNNSALSDALRFVIWP